MSELITKYEDLIKQCTEEKSVEDIDYLRSYYDGKILAYNEILEDLRESEKEVE